MTNCHINRPLCADRIIEINSTVDADQPGRRQSSLEKNASKG